ncbi:MAG: D-alanine--D-alanine ligase [Deltaproteobacteria bacterium]|nr:D-alanine--D-alanine ligase [Deltaproteobacteria bacterium]MBW1913346.1 D-alanine--D-alanine ligase [Deltaproteobacteria bacterium]
MITTKKISIALMAGGSSNEREISLNSGDTVYCALDKDKYNITRYDPRDDLELLFEQKANIDLALILLHGNLGEDGRIQGFLDTIGLPFVGSGVLASAIASDKKIAKRIYESTGLNVIKDTFLIKGENFDPALIMESLGPLTVVKPVSEGSSLGISVCKNREELVKGIHLAFQFNPEVLVEQFIKGREISCCVIGNKELTTLPLVEILPDKKYDFFNYEAKYTPGATREICPATIPEDIAELARDCARKAHSALKCTVWSRTDMIIKGSEVYILETNTIPGMTEASLVPLSAKAAGISLSQLLDRLIDLSLDPFPG